MTETKTQPVKQNVLQIIGAPEAVKKDGVDGFNVGVQGGTLFFKTDEMPSGDIKKFELLETLTGEGPIKDASYNFQQKPKEE
ncbi:MAG: hypothetical protein U9Q63_01465 [Patescibacteria group bacterium]|nr:hypothetical protein [Patescibacteria group bacterium]